MKNNLSQFKTVFTRLVTVVLFAAACLLLSTGVNAPPAVVPSASPVANQTPAAATPTPVPEYFELSFVGDITPASTPANKPLGVSYESVIGSNFAYPFENTAHYFAEDDFTFANFECVLSNATDASSKNFSFKADPAFVDILTSGNVDFVTLGNNHVLDYGEEGYADTKATLTAAGIAYAARDEGNIFETERGLKIGVYAMSFGKTAALKEGIAALRAAGADFVVAALHWGDEGSYDINKLQREQGHAAIDAGADFVYGSHPHTLQAFEEYNGKFIYYSMGNWSFGGNTAPRDPDTIILKLSLKRDIDGSVTVENRLHIPCAITGIPGGNDYRPVPYAEGSEEYNRTISKLDGTFEGENLTIGYTYGFNEF